MTVSSVMGCGTQKGASTDGVNEIRAASRSTSTCCPRFRRSWSCVTRMSRPLSRPFANVWPTVAWATASIFIRDIADAVRIRTGERGNAAL